MVLLATAMPNARSHEHRAVRYCFNFWFPYTREVDGRVEGISIDILREATARAGMRAEFAQLPWKRCLETVRRGEIDAVVDAAERPDLLQGPTSFSVYTNTFWVREDFPADEFDPAALAGKEIGLVDGYLYPEKLWEDLRSLGATIDSSVDDGTNIRKLAFGRVDAIIGDYVSTLVFVRENGLKLKPLSPSHSADRLYPSFNAERSMLQANIDSVLAEMVADGAVDRIYRRHLGQALQDILPQ